MAQKVGTGAELRATWLGRPPPIAIMRGERSHIEDPEVGKLADGIIDAHVREIVETNEDDPRLEAKLTPNGAPDLPSYRERGVASPAPQTDESAGINTLQPID